MPTTALGKTRFDVKGTWNSGTTYTLDDIVLYNGGWYIATSATIPAATLPTNTSYWASYRVAFNWRGLHVNTTGTSYRTYDTVYYTVTNTSTATGYTTLNRTNRQAYVCIADHTADGTNTYLPLNSIYWQPITSEGQRAGTTITVGTATSLDNQGVYGDDPRKVVWNGMANKGRVYDSTSQAVNPYYARGTGKDSTDAYQGTHMIHQGGGVIVTPGDSTAGSSGWAGGNAVGPAAAELTFFFHDWWRSASNGGSGVHSTPDNKLPRAIQVERGYNHGCVLFNNGEVHAWGAGTNAGIGDRATTNRTQPVRCGGTYTEVAVAANTTTHTLRDVRIVRISMSTAGNTCGSTASRHTLALDSTGGVWAWGYNGYGQCGDNTVVNVTVPKLIPQTNFNNRPVVAIWAFGGQYGWNFALNDQNQLYGWGYNGTGQLGNGSTTTTGVLVPTAITTQTWTEAVGAAGFVRKITSIGGQGTTAGAGSTAILTSTGKVFVAGKQATGQFMINSVAQTNSFTQCTSGPGSSSGAGARNVWLYGDPDNGCMMVRDNVDGVSWVAGYNAQYLLGDGSTTTNSSVAVRTKKWERGAYSDLTNVADLAHLSGGTSQSAMVLLDNGTIYGIGRNDGGQLATGWTGTWSFSAPGDGNGYEHEASKYAWLPMRMPPSAYGKAMQISTVGYKDNATTNYGGFIFVTRDGRTWFVANGASANGYQIGGITYALGSSDANHNLSMFRAMTFD